MTYVVHSAADAPFEQTGDESTKPPPPASVRSATVYAVVPDCSAACRVFHSDTLYDAELSGTSMHISVDPPPLESDTAIVAPKDPATSLPLHTNAGAKE